MNRIITQDIVLDFNTQSTYRYVNAKQGGNRSRYVKVTLTNNGNIYKPPIGTSANFRAQKPDGTMVLNSCVINDDGAIIIELTQQTLAVCGDVIADIYLSDESGSIISTSNFIINVVSPPSGLNITSENEILTLLKIVERAEKAVAQSVDAANRSEQAKNDAETAANYAMTIIDDDVVDINKTWSSNKIVNYVSMGFSNAIIGSLSGETVTTDMVSPVKHNVECYIHSTNLIASREVQTNASGNSSYPLTIREGYYTPQAFNADGSTTGITPRKTWIATLMDGTSTTIKSFAEKTYITADEARRTKSITVYFNHTEYKGTAQNVKFQLVSGEGLPNFVPHVSDLSSVVITRKAPDGSSLETFTPSEDSTVSGITSLYPAMTIETDTNGVTVEAAYHADVNKIIDKLFKRIKVLENSQVKI